MVERHKLGMDGRYFMWILLLAEDSKKLILITVCDITALSTKFLKCV